jgi:hypothetical protein
VGTLILQNPRNPLADFALATIDATIKIYSSVVQLISSSRMVTNLQWLLRLRVRIMVKMQQAFSGTSGANVTDTVADEDHMELLGLRTRLIQRAAQGLHTATTISKVTPDPVDSTVSPSTRVSHTIEQAVQQYLSNADENSAPLNSAEIGDTQTSSSLLHNEISTDDLVSSG